MAVAANTVETYDNIVIREDLAEQYSMVSPEVTPFQQAIGTGKAPTQPHHEWPTLELAAPDGANRVMEGEINPPIDAGTLAERISNYTQISDKVVSTTHTSEVSDAAANNIQQLAKQMVIKIRELKRDMEVMLLQNVAANPGASGTARVAAGFPAFIMTNTIGGVGGADPELSGGTNGYPDTAATPGAVVPFTEEMFNDVIQACWEEGGSPTIAMMNANNKRILSDTFTGAANLYKDRTDKKLVNAVEIYESDFGQLSAIPNRFQPMLASNNYYVALIDPEYAHVAFLETMRQKPLAETGHSKNRLLWCEYTLVVDNEKAHGIIRDTSGLAA